MAKSPSTTGAPKSGEVVQLSPFARMLRTMEGLADTGEGREIGADLNAILEAETEAEMWSADERDPINTKMLKDCELEITGFEVKYGGGASDDDGEEFSSIFVTPDGKQMYLLVTAFRLNRTGEKKVIRLPDVGEIFSFNTSAKYVVAKLVKMRMMGMFDNNATVKTRVEVTPIKGGKQSVSKLKEIGTATVTIEADAAREEQDNAAENPPF